MVKRTCQVVLLFMLSAGTALAGDLIYSVNPSLTPAPPTTYVVGTAYPLTITALNTAAPAITSNTIVYVRRQASGATCTGASFGGTALPNAVIAASTGSPWAAATTRNPNPYSVTFTTSQIGNNQQLCVRLDGNTAYAIGPFNVVNTPAPSATLDAVEVADITETAVDLGDSVSFNYTIDFGTAPTPNMTDTSAFSPKYATVYRNSWLDGGSAIPCGTSMSLVGSVAFGTAPYSLTGDVGYNLSVPTSSLAVAPGTTRVMQLCVRIGSGPYQSDTVEVSNPQPMISDVSASITAGQEIAQGDSISLTLALTVVDGPLPAGGNASVYLQNSDTEPCSGTFLTNLPYDVNGGVTSPVDITIPPSSAIGSPRHLCVTAGGASGATANSFEITESAPDLVTYSLMVFGPETTGKPNSDNPGPHITPATMMNGDTLTVSFDVYNDGNRVSSTGVNGVVYYNPSPSGIPCTGLYLTSFAIDGEDSNGIDPDHGEVQQVLLQDIPVSAELSAQEVHSICVTLDTNNRAGQTAAGRTNDSSYALLVGGALPDLVPVNISVSTDGPTAYLDFDIYNQGRGTSTEAHVRAYLSDLGYEHDFAANPDNIEIDLSDPCTPIASAKGSRVMGMGETPSCVPELETGLSQYYSAAIPLSGDFGSWSYSTNGGVSPLEGGGLDINLNTGQYAWATFNLGKYLWIVADSEKVEGLGAAGQVLEVLHENDEQGTWVNPWTISNIDSLSFDFANVASGPVSSDGDTGGSNPIVVIDSAYNGSILGWFGSSGSLAAFSGSCVNLTDATPRWDDQTYWSAGEVDQTWSQIEARRGGYSLDQIEIWFNWFGTPDNYDLDLAAVNINEFALCDI